MASLEGRKILVTGPTGQVAQPIALALAKQNQVWGVARFTDPAKRRLLESGGVRCVPADLDVGDFSALPDDFDAVLNFAVSKSDRDFDRDLRANGESTGLLMSHCRRARAFLHCSTTGVYQPAGHEVLREESELGDNHRVMMPTYSIAKIAAEVVARFAAREFRLPTIICRLNVPYGDNGGWPYYHLLMMKNGIPIPVHEDAPSVYVPIHEDDIVASIPPLLEAASVPATTLNWCGNERVSIEEWCTHLGRLTGVEPKFERTANTIDSVVVDDTKLRTIVGEPRVHWKDGLRRMVQARHPDWLV